MPQSIQWRLPEIVKKLHLPTTVNDNIPYKSKQKLLPVTVNSKLCYGEFNIEWTNPAHIVTMFTLIYYNYTPFHWQDLLGSVQF